MPPLWEKIQRMSGNLVATPLNTMWVMVRVESVANSIVEGPMPGTMLPQQFGVVGWT